MDHTSNLQNKLSQNKLGSDHDLMEAPVDTTGSEQDSGYSLFIHIETSRCSMIVPLGCRAQHKDD